MCSGLKNGRGDYRHYYYLPNLSGGLEAIELINVKLQLVIPANILLSSDCSFLPSSLILFQRLTLPCPFSLDVWSNVQLQPTSPTAESNSSNQVRSRTLAFESKLLSLCPHKSQVKIIFDICTNYNILSSIFVCSTLM